MYVTHKFQRQLKPNGKTRDVSSLSENEKTGKYARNPLLDSKYVSETKRNIQSVNEIP